jgi:hypothetical protein
MTSPTEVVDSELATLYAKVQELTVERDGALLLVEEAAKKLAEYKRKSEHFRHLWMGAEKRLKAMQP